MVILWCCLSYLNPGSAFGTRLTRPVDSEQWSLLEAAPPKNTGTTVQQHETFEGELTENYNWKIWKNNERMEKLTSSSWRGYLNKCIWVKKCIYGTDFWKSETRKRSKDRAGVVEQPAKRECVGRVGQGMVSPLFFHRNNRNKQRNTQTKEEQNNKTETKKRKNKKEKDSLPVASKTKNERAIVITLF